VVGGLVAIGGAWYVHHWHEAHRKADEGRSNFLDRGQPVVMEGWANEAAGLARVKYRGASWDARVAGGAARPTPGATLYIDAQEGQTLVVVDAPINK
jgi:membrane protein implicated in regulation of membrane protease activity